MTTRARDFKFAGAIVQRLYLVMVALTKKLVVSVIWLVLSWKVTFEDITTVDVSYYLDNL